jgi:hypothetical protein
MGGLALSESGTALLSALMDEEFTFHLVPPPLLPTDVKQTKTSLSAGKDWSGLYRALEGAIGRPLREIIPEKVLRDLPSLRRFDKTSLMKAGVPQGVLMLTEKIWGEHFGWKEESPVISNQMFKPRFGNKNLHKKDP